MTLYILKALYWVLNIVILYLYLADREVILSMPQQSLVIFSAIWVLLSAAYGYHLALYLFTRGKKGSCM